MKEWLTIVTEGGIVLIDWLALIIIIVGTIEAFFRGLHLMFSSPPDTRIATSGCAMRAGWWRA